MQIIFRLTGALLLTLGSLQLFAQPHKTKTAIQKKISTAATKKTGKITIPAPRRWNMAAEANAPVTVVKITQPDGTVQEETWKLLPY